MDNTDILAQHTGTLIGDKRCEIWDQHHVLPRQPPPRHFVASSPTFAMQLLYHRLLQTIMYANLVNSGLESYITLDNLREMSETNADTVQLTAELHGYVIPLLHKMSLMVDARDTLATKPEHQDIKHDESYQNLVTGVDKLQAIVKRLPTDRIMMCREKIVELIANTMAVDPLRHGSRVGKVVGWQECYISRMHLDSANNDQKHTMEWAPQIMTSAR
ncbi:hypothetical protein DOTSEDRAFT_25911 [Dothistroma septosporum NZE10]|uniref:Uncharacterized protein n=1 Tax=Dothistroma septosporum (strain NZE10 / CBS 128990) TaxID=675120 RepID=N1PLV5_DOTSN|nr:hypothetical protein DOTSEDRAFT_25911 [Dothistroma septosporum NZE10]